MALISLKQIGKIYVSESNVSVGIRGINLDFDLGEFVAITGESGSGKSTLLNVISGMDSYEEGELYINNQPTSHYMQLDWEEYREKYISFIFQNYNIIDSFTVLQNVELALMSIENPSERRKKALELIERVGLKSHIHHKGSKLSGGQKQRTVIARALAKNSPIILADEPTGNLDAKSSKEIIELLHEVSKDKLVIVVTHSYNEVKDFATRHIRIYDGEVETDKFISEPNEIDNKEEIINKIENRVINNKLSNDLAKGLHLGKILFTCRPKLSIYLCLLMIIASLGVLFSTVIQGDIGVLLEDNYMFNQIDGRVVISKRSGEIITDEELEKLSKETNANSYIHYDLLFDKYGYAYSVYIDKESGEIVDMPYITYVTNKDYGDSIIGRYPEKANEVFLYLPIYEKKIFGENSILIENIYISSCKFDVVGIKYFYNTNNDPEILLTEEGFKLCTAFSYLRENSKVLVSWNGKEGSQETIKISFISASFELEEDMIYINNYTYMNGSDIDENVKLDFISEYIVYQNYYEIENTYVFEENFNYTSLTTNIAKPINKYEESIQSINIFFHPNLLVDLSEKVLEKSYKQASLFYENDEEASKAIEKISEYDYIALLSTSKYEMSGEDSIIMLVGVLFGLVGWFISILFLAIFVNLCSVKSILVFKEDISIMRSMGIPTKVTKIAIYVRMFIALIPGVISIIIMSLLITRNPVLSYLFNYLYAWQYLLMILGLIIITLFITNKQIKKLYKNSVRESLKGGVK